MARTGRILIRIVVVIAALLIAAILFIALFNWNSARPWLDQRLTSSVGRSVAINGGLSVRWSRNPDTRGLSHWLPWPRFTARDVSIANPAWARQPEFTTIDAVQFSLAPLALLHHTIDIPSLKLVGPDVDVERDKQGRDNWTFHFAQGGQWNLHIGEVAFDAGKIGLDDDKLALHLDIEAQPLGKAIPFDQIVPPASAQGSTPAPHSREPYFFGWRATGTWRGARATGSGKFGSVLAVSNGSMPFPVQADLHLRDLHIALAGTLSDPVHLGALDLNLALSADSMSHLYALTGVNLPTTSAFSTHGRLVASIRRGVFQYQHFDGHVGRSDLHGSVTYATRGMRPELTGTLTSNVLDFADLAPLVGADSNAAKARRGEAIRQPADKVLPVETFDTARWRTMDADVTFSGKRIVRKGALPVRDLSTRITLDDGVLALDPVKLDVAGGDVAGNIRLDGSSNPMRGKANLRVHGIQLKRLFPGVDLMHTSLGQINGDAALAGRGNSVAALLGSSDGEVKLLVNNGAISKLLLEEAGLDVANIIATKLLGDKPEKINCAAVDFTARQGVWQPRLFLIDTDSMSINVDGSMDLANEKLNMTLHPHSKGVRILSLRSPLYLRGILKHPDAGVEKGPLLARGVGAVVLGAVAAPLVALAALIAPSHDNQNACVGVITAMRKPAKAH